MQRFLQLPFRADPRQQINTSVPPFVFQFLDTAVKKEKGKLQEASGIQY